MTDKSIIFGTPKKAKVKLVDGEVELEFPAITVEDIAPLLTGKVEKVEEHKHMKTLILKTLQRKWTDMTMGDVEAMPIANMMAILNKLLELNGFEIKEEKIPLVK